MTTEREQLTRAAKACGYNVKFVIGAHAKNDALGSFMINYGTSNRRSWNPLKSDGDCARMEAQLGINLEWLDTMVVVWHRSCDANPFVQYRKYASHNGNKNAARRAASVAVAAEIGRLK